MVLKIYGHPLSSYTRLVMVVAKEVGIKYEFVKVDLTKYEHRTPEYNAKQPFGKVPYIDDDGFILYESRAIARYLATKVNSPLLPTELKEAALFEQAASTETSAFDQPVGRIRMERFVKKYLLKQEINEEVVNEAITLLSKNLDVYDAILGKTRYLAGDNITLADLFHLSGGSGLPPVDVNIMNDSSRLNVARWRKELSNRPSWLEVLVESA